MTADELKVISRKSRDVLRALGPGIGWQQSYVTEDELYGVCTAPNKEIIRKRVEMAAFAMNRISEVSFVNSPETGD